MKKTIFAILLMVLPLFVLAGSDDWKWGEKSEEAQGEWMNVTRSMRKGDYHEAARHLSWLMENTPELNESLYITAAQVYQYREQIITDKQRKREIQDSVMLIYDKRQKYFGHEAQVLNDKGVVAWRYLYDRGGKEDELYQLYDKIYTLNGENMLVNNASSLVVAAALQFKKQKLPKAKVVEYYGAMSNLLDNKTNGATGQQKQLIESTREYMDYVFNQNVPLNCDEVAEYYGSKFETEKDIKTAKTIFSLMGKQKCFANPLFISSAELVAAQEPTFQTYNMLGQIYQQQKDGEKAYANYTQALTLSPDSVTSADIYMKLAEMDAAVGKKSQARENAYKAVAHDRSRVAAYTLIGDLYFNSADNCKQGDPVKDRLMYIAAYEKYKLAGNSAKMASAKSQFPAIDDIFLRDMKVGDAVNTGCWAAENVTLQKR